MTQQEFFARYTYNVRTDKIGGGSFGTVYKAFDEELNKEVAIKVSEVKLIGNKEFSLKDEFEAIKNLPTHKNVANYESLYTYEMPNGIFDYAVMQFYQHGNLSLAIKQGMSAEQKVQVATDLLHGIQHLHSHKVVHRDLKPGNILIVKRGDKIIPIITDFGLSKQIWEDEASRFSMSFGGGTLKYSSPEQLRAEKIRLNTDLWSYGVIIYQIFTGKDLFYAENQSSGSTDAEEEIIKQIKSKGLSNDLKKLPAKWREIAGKCLVRDASKRVKSAEELIEILHGKKPTDETPIPPPEEDKTEVKDSSDDFKSSDEYNKPDETIIEHKKSQKQEEKNREQEKETLQKDEKKKNKAIVPAIFIGVLLVIGLFIWQPWSSKQNSSTSFTDFTEIANGVDIEMVAVKGGTLTMGCTNEQGSDCYDDEKPAHSVTLSSYNIGKYEVTQGQWKAVMVSNPSASDKGIGDIYPVNNVSWNDIQTFITKLNQMTGKRYRLPTEAEWEYAARGGSIGSPTTYAGSNNIGSVAWYDDNSGNKTHPVGQKQANELGIYDMCGNVWEWCSDWYGDYNSNSQTNPKGPSSGSYRVLRGGSWSYIAGNCRVSYRNSGSPGSCFSNGGFRLVLVP